MRHYRCYEVHVQKTLAKRIGDIITFLLYNLTIPNLISVTNAISHIKDLIKLLTNYKSHYPIPQHYDDSILALKALIEIFNNILSKTIELIVTKPHLIKSAIGSKPSIPKKEPHSNTKSSPRIHAKETNTKTPTTNQFVANMQSIVQTSYHIIYTQKHKELMIF